jgi:endonuclease/exonuclease/phosphatase family metal-dependent hydrolase
VAKRFSLLFYLFVIMWLALGIVSMNISPLKLWYFGFLGFSTPIPLLLNLLFFGYWLSKRSWSALLPLFVIVIAYGYYERGISFRLDGSLPSEIPGKFEVLSFNTQVFNTYAHLRDSTFTSSINMIDWVARHPADIILLQEFYNDPGSAIYTTEKKIGVQQGRESFVSAALVNRIRAEFGLAIFSRFPILSRGQIFFGERKDNHAIFADLKVHSDTLRVYNIHLESMVIKDELVVEAVRKGQVQKHSRETLRRLREGFLARSQQVDSLLLHIASSPYPVVVGGDFNDIPWSYTYEQFNHHLTNAFQARGTGLGVTYNGKIPFLRIDNQFFSERVLAHTFAVHYEMTYSDHFPISVLYTLKK